MSSFNWTIPLFQVQRLGYCRPGKVRRTSRWLLHPGTVRHYDVRRHLSSHVQKYSQLAPRPCPRLREHSHCSGRQQGRHRGPEGQGKVDRFSQEEESAGKFTARDNSEGNCIELDGATLT